MSGAVHVMGAWRTEDSRYVHVGGQWRKASSVVVHAGGSWRQGPAYVPPFSASAPSGVSGYQSTARPMPTLVNSDVATVTPNGGVAPYSYSWARSSGDTRITALTPSQASTRFQARLSNQEADAAFTWTVTDSAGATVSGQTTVELIAESGGNQ